MDYIDHMVLCPQGATLQLCIEFLRGWVAKELAAMQIFCRKSKEPPTTHPSPSVCYRKYTFYQLRQIEDHGSVLEFNYFPLSSVLIAVLTTHHEIVSDEALVCWTAE